MLKLLWCIIFTTVSFAQTAIYKLSKNDTEIYLFATINLLRNSDYPLDEKYDTLFNQLEHVYFETNLNALVEQKAYDYFVNQLKFHDKQTLQSQLSRPAYFKLANISRNHGLKIKEYEQYNITMLLNMIEFTIRFNHASVDTELSQRYLNKALKMKKKITYLSSIYAYLDHLNLKNKKYDLKELDPLLQRLDYINEEYETIIQAWKEGKLSDINSIFYYYGSNQYLHNKWISVIQKAIQSQHNIGIFLHASAFKEDSVFLQKLKVLGYNIQQL